MNTCLNSFLSTAHIKGTEVIAQKIFTFTQEEANLNFEGYGFKVHIPEGSLPADVSETQLNVQVSLSGQFQMPSNCELVSAVYWVSCPHKFMKHVEVEIQHCTVLSSDKQCAQLTFVHTKHTQKELPYLFQEQGGGVFCPHTSYGCLSLSHFCGIGIVKRLFQWSPRAQPIQPTSIQAINVQPVQSVSHQATDSAPDQAIDSELGQQLQQRLTYTEAACQTVQEEKDEIVVQYCAQLYTRKLEREWKVDFVVTKDLDSCSTVSDYLVHQARLSFTLQRMRDSLA